jgi:hypothetical protein
MATRKLLLATLCLTAAASLAPAVSSAGVNVDIDVAPPAPRVEVVPAARPGWVWAPGYWAWRGREHVWVGGRCTNAAATTGYPMPGSREVRTITTCAATGSAEADAAGHRLGWPVLARASAVEPEA